MKRIGITIDANKSIFSNGINQNAIYFANLLNEIGYNVYLIHISDQPIEDILGIKTIHLDKSLKIPFHLLFQFGLTMHQSIMDKFKSKNKNVKLVAYECGNKYIMDMENMLFKPERDDYIKDRAKPDQIWSIPQMENSNIHYYKFINNQEKATVVPFIWEPLAIKDRMSELGVSTYTPRELKRIGVFEANISVMKNMLFPTIAINKYHKQHRNNLENVILFSTKELRNHSTFISIINATQLAKDKILFANARIDIVEALNKLSDIVFSTQWENNLNYLWLDVAWMGWPVIHNGNLCQDVGYYYNSFDADESVSKLKYVIENHNQDSEYIERNRSVISRYTHKNNNLKEQYKMLVEDVLSDKFKKYSYNWKTNSIE